MHPSKSILISIRCSFLSDLSDESDGSDKSDESDESDMSDRSDDVVFGRICNPTALNISICNPP